MNAHPPLDRGQETSRRRRRHPLRLVLALAVAIPLSGCGGSADEAPQPTARLPKGAPVVTVAMREFRFAYDGTIPAGRVAFRFVNEGKLHHQPALIPLPEDLPPLAEQLKGSQRRIIQPTASLYPHRPGAAGSFAVDLAPGTRYGLVCFMGDSQNGPYSRKGMNVEFRTPGTRPASDSQ